MISGRPNLQDDREWTERIMNNMYHAGWEKGISEERARWKKKIEEMRIQVERYISIKGEKNFVLNRIKELLGDAE